MNVVVCLHAQAGGNPSAPTIPRTDALALDQAIALAAREPGHQVTAMLAGSAAQTAPLTEALAAGAARAVRIAGEELVNADFHTFGQIFAAGIRRLGADLVLTGLGSDGDGVGAVPASTARQLGFVHVSGIEEISNCVAQPGGGGTVDVVVRGGGRTRRLRVTLPAVLSVAAGGPGSARPPQATAAKAEVEVLSFTDPERTVVRRRAELLGSPEPASRSPQTVSSAAAFAAALRSG